MASNNQSCTPPPSPSPFPRPPSLPFPSLVASKFMTMKRQVKHMIKHKYVPWNWGKAKYKGSGSANGNGGGPPFKNNK